MANKIVPSEIAGVSLHNKVQKKRTSTLLRELEEHGVRGLTSVKSQSDRIRLLATFIYENSETVA